MIKTILVPTDGSQHASKAVDLAADVAGKYEARMVILHVLLHHTLASDLRALCQSISASPSLIKELEELENRSFDTVGTSLSDEYEPVSELGGTDMPMPAPRAIQPAQLSVSA